MFHPAQAKFVVCDYTIEYGVFDGVPTDLYSKLYLRNLIDEGTGSTFNALEARNLITCRYANLRRSGKLAFERFLTIQITPPGSQATRRLY